LKQGIVLFAHGSRDPQWARPLEALSKELGRKLAGVPIRLAYLEIMRPSLEEAVSSLAAGGAKSIRVVPVFLASGDHVKEDLPKLLEASGAKHPGVRLVLDEPIGEQPEVIAAIAQAIAARFGAATPESSARRPKT
jgi:sirohydrochlorin cobaltochelatase